MSSRTGNREPGTGNREREVTSTKREEEKRTGEDVDHRVAKRGEVGEQDGVLVEVVLAPEEQQAHADEREHRHVVEHADDADQPEGHRELEHVEQVHRRSRRRLEHKRGVTIQSSLVLVHVLVLVLHAICFNESSAATGTCWPRLRSLSARLSKMAIMNAQKSE